MMPLLSTPVRTASGIEPAWLMRLMARMWFLCPSSTGLPVPRLTPREVPKKLFSMSWTARALPERIASTQPPSIRLRKGSMPSVWMTTGPATKMIRLPSSRVRRICRATRLTLVSTLRSELMSLLMKAKVARSPSVCSRLTRTPETPHTTRSPARTSRSLRHRGSPSSRTITASMRWAPTVRHTPSSRTSVRWLVVE